MWSPGTVARTPTLSDTNLYLVTDKSEGAYVLVVDLEYGTAQHGLEDDVVEAIDVEVVVRG